jgi:hypothetical protein
MVYVPQEKTKALLRVTNQFLAVRHYLSPSQLFLLGAGHVTYVLRAQGNTKAIGEYSRKTSWKK